MLDHMAVTENERAKVRDQAAKWFGQAQSALPVAFTYDDVPSSEFLPSWTRERTEEKLDEHRTRETITCRDRRTGLVFRCVAVTYADFPTVEWTCSFENAGPEPTPIIRDILPLDIAMERREKGEFLLHHAAGSSASRSDYGPRQTALPPEATKRITAAGGRATNGEWSYFNLEWGDEGIVLAVGWPGQWDAEFVREGERGIRVRAGQEVTHFRLHPGEVVRTPLIVIQFWSGDGGGSVPGWIRAQNVWRRWMTRHNVPKPGGVVPQPLLLGSSGRAYEEMIGANEANQIMFIDRYREEGFDLDYWWMDAGWYPQEKGWPQTGTWEVDTKRFPNGFKPISDHAHERGVKILVWFEPERVAAGTWLAENHPEWILGGKDGGLLNLGDEGAWNWLVNHVDRLITENGIDLYRQDFNMDPLEFWRKNDAPDRQGITEIKHVTGYLAYWDELRRRHPDMLIDSCASGGRRNDIETMRRAVPLWRSDYAYEEIGTQAMTYGISFWLPFHGTGTVATTSAPYYGSGATPVVPYSFWSNAAPGLACGVDVRERGIDYAALRRLFENWRGIGPCYYGDYYPLTPYRLESDVWLAWQFNRPDEGDGFVQAFRRGGSPYESARFILHGLDPDARYRLTDLDEGQTWEATGRELLETGLLVTLTERPAASVIAYERM